MLKFNLYWDKIIKIIDSCETIEQLQICFNLIQRVSIEQIKSGFGRTLDIYAEELFMEKGITIITNKYLKLLNNGSKC